MHKLLKRLAVLSFLLLFLPFCQMCSDEEILTNSWLKNSPLREEVIATVTATDSLINETAPEVTDTVEAKEYHLTFGELKQKKIIAIRLFKEAQQGLTYTGYELAYIPILDFEWFDIMLAYSLVVLLCIFQLYFSFTRSYRKVFILSVMNAILLLIPIILAYCSEQLEDIAQIRCGYYLFYANMIVMMYLSYKLYKSRKNHNNSVNEATDI